jgi:CRP-like cAMP-binding protein
MDIPSTSIPELVEGTAPDRPLAALEQLAILGRYDTDQCVYHCNDSIEHWYRVVRGAARSSALSDDGRRYIVDFVFPGDLFGFCGQRARHFCVEAIVSGTLIARYPRDRAEKLADSNPQIGRNIRQAAFESIARMQKRTAILGRASALEKVSGFLLEMSDRGAAAATGTVFLPMPRYDIADYLAMAVETVSRTLTELRTRRTIVFRDPRHVCICDRGALEHFASCLIDTQRQPATRREQRTHEDLSRSLPQPVISSSRTATPKVQSGEQRCS